MNREEWDKVKDTIQDRDREISEEFLARELPHYSVRYSSVMAVHSEFVNWERREQEKAQSSNLESYSLD